MKICTFFGHRMVCENIEAVMSDTLNRLIDENGIDTFYVGHNGEFDRRAYGCLKKAKETYPKIKIYVVLSTLPGKKKEFRGEKTKV